VVNFIYFHELAHVRDTLPLVFSSRLTSLALRLYLGRRLLVVE